MGKRVRKSNFFEIVLLIVGLGVLLVGFKFIADVYNKSPQMSWEALSTVFLWLLLFVMIVMLATEEDVKEELGIIMKENIEEVRLLREETELLKEQMQYLKEDTALMKTFASDAVGELRTIRQEIQRRLK